MQVWHKISQNHYNFSRKNHDHHRWHSLHGYLGYNAHAPQFFKNQEELDAYKASLRVVGPYEQLWDETPDKFPCLMLIASRTYNPDGADYIHNLFLYDVEAVEEDEENA